MNLQEISLADQRQMFQGSLVRYDGEPVVIQNISHGGLVDCLFIGNNSEKALVLYDKLFDFKPVNTGYVNIQGYTFFVSRTTRRQFKQGLSRDNVNIKYNVAYGNERHNSAFERLMSLSCKPLYNTIKNIYPKLEQAVESFEDNVVEAAFDRQFSVNSNGSLFYKAKEVGQVKLDTLKIDFYPDYEYLRNAL